MDKTQVSLTAIMTAYLRAYHSKYDDPKIFDDFLACDIIPEERRRLIEEGFMNSVKLNDPEFAATSPNLASALARVMPGLVGLCHTLGRSRYVEETLAQAISQGVKQYVILGAGMDTFAFRCPELLKEIQVFEVDHPGTQAFKLARLEELGWEVPSQLHFVPVDFAKDSLETELLKSSFDTDSKSLFSWLGVSMYLTRHDIFKTLSSIKEIAPTGSAVVFDYLDQDAFHPDKAAPRIKRAILMAKYAGELMQTGFDPETLGSELSRVGLRLAENLKPQDLQSAYFEGSKYLACEHLCCAQAEVV